MCCSSPSAPAAPDYTGAAVAQGAANKEAAIAGAMASNPNITNPYGSQTVSWASTPVQTYDTETGTWRTDYNYTPTVTQSLSPESQALYDKGVAIDKRLMDMASTGAQRVEDTLATPYTGDAATRKKVEDALYAKMASRLDPMWAQRERAVETNLVNRGMNIGSTGYADVKDQIGRERTDAYQQAILDSIINAGSEQQRQLQTDLTIRQLPLNELNALRSGAQIATPQFQGFTGTSMNAGDIQGATTAAGNWATGLYNADAAQYGSNMSTLGSLGAAAITYA